MSLSTLWKAAAGVLAAVFALWWVQLANDGNRDSPEIWKKAEQGNRGSAAKLVSPGTMVGGGPDAGALSAPALSASNVASLMNVAIGTEGFNSARAYVQHALTHPTDTNLQIASHLALWHCPEISDISSDPRYRAALDKLPKEIKNAFDRQVNFCTGTQEVDSSQRRSLVAARKRIRGVGTELDLKTEGDAILAARSIDDQGDIEAALRFGVARSRAEREAIYGTGGVLGMVSNEALLFAWMANICQTGKCDELPFRVRYCADYGQCGGGELAEIMDGAAIRHGADPRAWSAVKKMVAERQGIFLPKIIGRPN